MACKAEKLFIWKRIKRQRMSMIGGSTMKINDTLIEVYVYKKNKKPNKLKRSFGKVFIAKLNVLTI